MHNMQVYGVQPEDWSKATLSVVVVGASGELIAGALSSSGWPPLSCTLED